MTITRVNTVREEASRHTIGNKIRGYDGGSVTSETILEEALQTQITQTVPSGVLKMKKKKKKKRKYYPTKPVRNRLSEKLRLLYLRR